jgi:DNA-binding NtrC family response regulator
MVVGNLDGRLAAAAQIAMSRGATVRHADGVETALRLLRAGHGADLLLVDVADDIRSLAARLEAARLAVPIVACGAARDGGAAVHSDTREYVPLPADPDVIAAILAAVSDNGQEFTFRAALESVFEQNIPSNLPPAGQGRGETVAAQETLDVMQDAAGTVMRSLFGRTVADVERDLILETLKRCLGNRTHAAAILGISVRTLRNKLTVYAAEGIDVPPPNSGDIRGAA